MSVYGVKLLNSACVKRNTETNDKYRCKLNTQQCVCQPKIQCDPGSECGSQSDGCGGIIPCGLDCKLKGPQQTCGYKQPNMCSCKPKAKCVLNQCGSEDDGCGGVIKCGTPEGKC